jgi:hypothetical protein
MGSRHVCSPFWIDCALPVHEIGGTLLQLDDLQRLGIFFHLHSLSAVEGKSLNPALPSGFRGAIFIFRQRLLQWTMTAWPSNSSMNWWELLDVCAELLKWRCALRNF